ncbi:class I SAM-dependent methyltransferase [Nocardia terpenica]|uniref:class I SAM-dependent methyltransferase n=1 Tax=Nocardia terpenica TaxID=455432 RepID=UPI0018941F0F|nr:class I SAM-dependent methyltransferase [Nocardia terpenica]MBF6060682.1 class I SAM-dependent methyltransferase [Nocardia terpenica]MBF6103942.1 class I SAM-dependent methyltransferase [Nocardia terpenica]MBF6111684.1 class I SAM-dependent methyltransferase [Nocardia terpenica]MBF6118163.1 class I SAM-dependent methyltransferase [Nocardia terpenica]MBF6156443.1 class I SAM-dependent methyltransferase [Nocardia terpenica]
MTASTSPVDESNDLALGDYHRFARAALGELGAELVTACDIGPGTRVLDIGTGTGHVALAAALSGAEVVTVDTDVDNCTACRAEALRREVDLEWARADAQDLPFPDSSFDIVVSSGSATFLPAHQDVADELLRVTRPGGVIGMTCWTRRSWICEILATLAHYDPPAADALPARLWSSKEHLLWLFGDRIADLDLTAHSFRRTAPTPAQFIEFFETAFDPILTAFTAMADHPERAAALHTDLLDLADRRNLAEPDRPAEYLFEYVVLTATAAT